MTSAVLDVSDMVWTFHVSRQILVLGQSRSVVPLTSANGLSSEVVLLPVIKLKSTTGSVNYAFIVVSVT